ncbi:MAG: glycosyltransferase [Patescibacteria group bacterium]
MKVCFFGIYDPKYARNRVLYEGFTRNGWEVSEVRVDPRKYRGFRKYVELAKLGMRARREKFDLVLVCFPGQTTLPLARLIFGKNVVFDAFLSLYDSNVFDRQVYGPWSIRGRRDWLLDACSSRLAGKVLFDTYALRDYFISEFGIPREKCIRVLIGADDKTFFPMQAPEAEVFTVHFHGTFIPLQGIAHIVEAANILRNEPIRFRIIGHGQESEAIDARIRSLDLDRMIERVPKVPIEKIPGYMAGAHVVLGIFGDTEKAKRAIPNKVYEAMAMGKAIITADARGIHELSGARDVFALVPAADPQALASAILELKNNEGRRRALGEAARLLFECELLPERLVARLLEELHTS